VTVQSSCLGRFARVPLTHRLNLGFNLNQSSLQGSPPCRVRSPLRKNVLPLQIERLSVTLVLGMTLLRQPPSVFTYKAGRVDLRLLQGICHSLLQGFTFLIHETYLHSTRV
jgi:hypothetical protein